MPKNPHYDTDRLVEQALDAIEKYDLVRIGDVYDCVECHPRIARSDPHNIHKNEKVRDALAKKRIQAKADLRKQWKDYDTSSPTERIALYKLCANEEELDILTMNRHEHTGKGGEKLFGGLSDDELDRLGKKVFSKLETLKQASEDDV